MKIYCVLGFALLLSSLHGAAQSSVNKSVAVYTLAGLCVDTTGMGRVGPPGNRPSPRATIYALTGKGRERVDKCDAADQFSGPLPAATTQLLIEADGYKPLTMPVHFANAIPSNAQFRIHPILIPTTSSSTYPDEEMQLSSYLDVVDSIAVRYQLTDQASMKRTMGGLSKYHFKAQGLSLPMSAWVYRPGTYAFTVTTLTKELISEEEINLKRGYNFSSIRIVKPSPKMRSATQKAPGGAKKAVSTFTDIYFEQSNYELHPADKLVLDSLVGAMAGQPTSRLRITGYTDNVGNREANRTLSEYRAKTVGQYVKQRGVPDSKIIIDWQGPSADASPTDPETVKAQSRRVRLKFTAD